MPTNTVFVTGTDTDVGKSLVSGVLLRAFAARGLVTAGFKPVAAGCQLEGEQWVNEDARLLQRLATLPAPLSVVNPYALEAPIAPHIAAEQQGVSIDFHRLDAALETLMAGGPDWLLVEGAGGWRLPLGEGRFLSDWVGRHAMPVVLVVGMRLGCLNHALLTAEAICRDGLTLAGWVANRCVPEQASYRENLATLAQLLPAPLLGELPHFTAQEQAFSGTWLDIEPLIHGGHGLA